MTLMMGNRMDYEAFAASWQDGWNSHNLDRIMKHYRHDIVFRSQKAVPTVGHGEIHGREALEEYWSRALIRQPDLQFTVENLFEGYEMMVITYRNHRDVLAAETLYFDAAGLVFQASACHCNTA